MVKTEIIKKVELSSLEEKEIQKKIMEVCAEYENSADYITFTITEKGDELAVDYVAHCVPFERIRRITGYLVGSIDRWNNAKRAEEHDRLKHA